MGKDGLDRFLQHASISSNITFFLWKYKNTNLSKFDFFPSSGIALLKMNNFWFPDYHILNSNSNNQSPLKTDHMQCIVLTAVHVFSQFSKQLFYGMSPKASSSFCRWGNRGSETYQNQKHTKIIQIVNDRTGLKCRQPSTSRGWALHVSLIVDRGRFRKPRKLSHSWLSPTNFTGNVGGASSNQLGS